MKMEEEDEGLYRDNMAASKLAESLSCVIFLDTGKWLDAIGSGTLIEIGNRYFVATAAHVIRECNRQQLCIGSILITHHYFRIVDLQFLGGRDEDKEDLAWIEIEIPSLFKIENIITEENLYLSQLTVEDPILVSGYPEEFTDNTEKERVYSTNLAHFGYVTGISYDKDWDSAFDRSYHILLEYNREMRIAPRKLENAPAAWGLSGGGIWMNDKTKRSMRLAGIQVSWDGPREQLHGIKIGFWLDFLRSSHPKLMG